MNKNFVFKIVWRIAYCVNVPQYAIRNTQYVWLIPLLFVIVAAAFWRQTAAAQTTPYPGPRPTPTLAAGAAYPGGQPTAVSQPPTAYPVQNIPVTEATATPIPRVGDNPQAAPAAAPPDEPAAATPARNNVVMWAGFLLGLLIFLVAVYAAIILYTRKQM